VGTPVKIPAIKPEGLYIRPGVLPEKKNGRFRRGGSNTVGGLCKRRNLKGRKNGYPIWQNEREKNQKRTGGGNRLGAKFTVDHIY